MSEPVAGGGERLCHTDEAGDGLLPQSFMPSDDEEPVTAGYGLFVKGCTGQRSDMGYPRNSIR